jgi:predicted signal transduction protein with EAL and GGDEF domain
VSAAKAVFSVFIEQITNMLMYSAQKEKDVSVGMLALGQKGDIFFVQTRNAIRTRNVGIVKERIDHLNTLDKKELRKYYKEQLNSDNENPESQGAGLGLIDIARRTTSPIEYQFEPIDDELSYFTMYAEIARDGGH